MPFRHSNEQCVNTTWRSAHAVRPSTMSPPATRCDKLALRHEATVLVAAINEWL